MSGLPEVARTSVEGSASRLAFEIGQSLEALLIDRAARLAVGTGERVVTIAHVRRVLDDSLIAEACSRAGVVDDAETRRGRSRAAPRQ